MRFQELMSNVLHGLGIPRIDRLVSLSHLKYNAIINSGIQVVDRLPFPKIGFPQAHKSKSPPKKLSATARQTLCQMLQLLQKRSDAMPGDSEGKDTTVREQLRLCQIKFITGL
ncbi:hypothetical protein [Microcoleus sp. CAWBG58]|uniref:hypothetical protein n=1 Tax=Microcoleus sp. CAWBG58 TaxID=2841651 RepID=UPI0025E0E2F6|nr:hypothetical protein [Microcoleus sp. CAWBG58]